MSDDHAPADHGHGKKDPIVEYVKMHETYNAWRNVQKVRHAQAYAHIAKKHLGGGKELHKLRDEKVRQKTIDDLAEFYLKEAGLKPKDDMERDQFLYALIGSTKAMLKTQLDQLKENYTLEAHESATNHHLEEMEKIHLNTVFQPLQEHAADKKGRQQLLKYAGLEELAKKAEDVTANDAVNNFLKYMQGPGRSRYDALADKHVYKKGGDHAHH